MAWGLQSPDGKPKNAAMAAIMWSVMTEPRCTKQPRSRAASRSGVSLGLITTSTTTAAGSRRAGSNGRGSDARMPSRRVEPSTGGDSVIGCRIGRQLYQPQCTEPLELVGRNPGVDLGRERKHQ